MIKRRRLPIPDDADLFTPPPIPDDVRERMERRRKELQEKKPRKALKEEKKQ